MSGTDRTPTSPIDDPSGTRPREYRQPCPRCQSQRIVCDTLQIDLETTKRAQECLSCDLRGPSADDEQGATREWNTMVSVDDIRAVLNGCKAVDPGVAWTTNLARVCQLAGEHAEWRRRALSAEAKVTE